MLAYIPSRTGLGVLSLADAIARQENTPSSWNNPGALTAAPNRYCQTGKINGIVQFCTPQDGWNALNNQLDIYAASGDTLQQTIYHWAPADDGVNPLLKGNNPATYTNNVSNWTGIDPNTPLNGIGNNLIDDVSLGTSDSIYPEDNTMIDNNSLFAGMGIPDLNFNLYNDDGSVNWVMVGGLSLASLVGLKMVMG
jgi:hypothetical protein